MPDNDTRQRLIEELMRPTGPTRPSYKDMYGHILRTPGLREQFTPDGPRGIDLFPPQTTGGDPHYVAAIRRMLGMDIPGNLRVGEGHAIVERDLDRRRR